MNNKAHLHGIVNPLVSLQRGTCRLAQRIPGQWIKQVWGLKSEWSYDLHVAPGFQSTSVR